MDIIASGPHNGGGLDMTILNGLQPEPPRAIVASFRGLGQTESPSPLPLIAGVAALFAAVWFLRRK